MNIRLSTLFARNDDFGFVTMAVLCLLASSRDHPAGHPGATRARDWRAPLSTKKT
jgi:hypothetical protein